MEPLALLILWAACIAWARMVSIKRSNGADVGILLGIFLGPIGVLIAYLIPRGRLKSVEIFSRLQSSSHDALYQELLRKAGGNQALVDRLIEFERKRMPDASREELARSAIERWERDRR
jgi:hypothetical protein